MTYSNEVFTTTPRTDRYSMLRPEAVAEPGMGRRVISMAVMGAKDSSLSVTGMVTDAPSNTVAVSATAIGSALTICITKASAWVNAVPGLLSVTVMETFDDPAAVGVPLMMPSADSARPGGSAPAVTA